FAERNQMSQVSGAHRASASAGIGLLTGKIDFNAHIEESFSFSEHASEELTQPGHQTARLTQGKDPGVIGFFVEHSASMLHRVI
ncbi:MAG TPA: hypothetical protein VN743_13845, partial [Blastocatellia bacterium]|nr:hypothetical protein [Blastocatellia bacterium]